MYFLRISGNLVACNSFLIQMLWLKLRNVFLSMKLSVLFCQKLPVHIFKNFDAFLFGKKLLKSFHKSTIIWRIFRGLHFNGSQQNGYKAIVEFCALMAILYIKWLIYHYNNLRLNRIKHNLKEQNWWKHAPTKNNSVKRRVDSKMKNLNPV